MPVAIVGSQRWIPASAGMSGMWSGDAYISKSMQEPLDCVHNSSNRERNLDSLVVARPSPKTAYTFCGRALIARHDVQRVPGGAVEFAFFALRMLFDDVAPVARRKQFTQQDFLYPPR